MHHMNVDTKGNLYVTEIQDGKRIQKFVFKGMKQVPTNWRVLKREVAPLPRLRPLRGGSPRPRQVIFIGIAPRKSCLPTSTPQWRRIA
jgi:hypothetical protein